MSVRSQFIIFPRFKNKKGKKAIYYVQFRQPNGSLTNARSTGCTNRTDAFLAAQRMIDSGEINVSGELKFHSYASLFFNENSSWVKDKRSLGTTSKPAIGEKQLIKYRGFVRNYFLPLIENINISAFTPSSIKEFRNKLIKSSNISRKSINDVMSCLHIIMRTALYDGLIQRDAFRGISPLITEPKPRDAFTIDLVKILVKYPWSHTHIQLFMLTAALTGMRLSEINSLRKDNIHSDYIDLVDQYRGGKLLPLKTRESRKIPICEELHNMLIQAIPDGKDFVFDALPDDKASDDLREMLVKTMPEERIKHGYCFHSLRHFANTFYLDRGILPIKVAAVMGHSTGVTSMQERYTNFSSDNFAEFYEVQAELLSILIK